MLLEKEKVAEVLDKVARYYDVSIQYDKDAASRRLSGKLNLCDSIESVLDIIKVSASLQMEKTGDNKYRFYLKEIDSQVLTNKNRLPMKI